MSSRKTMAYLAAISALALAGENDKYYRHNTNRSRPLSTDPQESKSHVKPIKTHERILRQFSFKGHKIMAFSKKDAITRLKHQKLI